ncbi:GNAT family N-acetyltransferase [Amycolatopsis jejuensis]|uniref:GNAT family N-acetyltransferase n=1 Tax=Amycolatopsis jejuensis TaxID=330084 RepID=UPI000AB46ECC|nr:GNAT family protein [Amycolatopsis jejuensis]
MAPDRARFRGLPFAVADPACFSVVELGGGALTGEGLLWGIDLHNRMAHLGIALRPSFHGRGLGTDAIRVLCDYGFTVRGLHRIQAETLADNAALLGAATACGFQVEGTLGGAAWVSGRFVDLVVLGLLAPEWPR